jgi:cytochrome subunit of sulfide dehydrogenase
MRKAVATLVLLLAATSAAAQPASPAGAAACSGCHPRAGAGGSALQPLAGRAPDEIVAAMRAFRTGERPATVMDRIAKGFSEDETKAIAAWVSVHP